MEEDKTPECHAGTRKQWRAWLQRNHKKERKVYLIKFKKHTGKPSLNNREAMEEAICFGWIDTTVKKLDEDRYRQAFAKRTKNSRWSNNTLSYAKDMIKQGKMTEQGMKYYLEGRKKPTLDHGLPRNPETPIDLKVLLDKSKKAKEFFNKLAPSYKRFYIYWIEKAKLPETRKRRIKQVFKDCKEQKKPGQP